MKIFPIMIFAVLAYVIPSQNAFGQFQYISPKPNSLFHNPETNIILKNGDFIDAKSLNASLVKITGSVSGVHACTVSLSSDNKTILIFPKTKFAEGEVVSVEITDGFRKKTGETIHGVSFTFNIHPHRTPAQIAEMHDAIRNIKIEEYGEAYYKSAFEHHSPEKMELLCDLPEFELTTTPAAFEADVFYRNQPASPTNGCHARTIISNEGDSVYTDFNLAEGVDFKVNDNGYLTYYNVDDSTFDMMDSTYTLVKQFGMGNGYDPDEHEFRVYPNGYSFLFCYDVQIVDMSQYVANGDTAAVVTGVVIQELNENQDVVFEWQSWDHFPITDAVSQINLTFHTIDYVHANSMDLDYDGNLLLSSRHLSEITKIDLNTGEIIWRLGGENNEFTFIDEISQPYPFYYQHHFRRIANGHYTMFDNGKYENPQESVAKEYALDQVNKTATLVWSYIHPEIGAFNVLGNAMGSVQRLPNGNTFIDWGLLNNQTLAHFPNFTEVDSAGNIVWEFRFKDSTYVSYRAFKVDWNRCPPPIDSTFIISIVSTDSVYIEWGDPNYASSYIFEYKLAGSTDWISIPLATNNILLSDLILDSTYNWRVGSTCAIFNDSSAFSPVQTFSILGTATNFDLSEHSSLYAFPNPAHDAVNISFVMEKGETVDFAIVDMLGDVLKNEVWNTHQGPNLVKVSTRGLAAGVYMIELMSSGYSGRQQIVIH